MFNAMHCFAAEMRPYVSWIRGLIRRQSDRALPLRRRLKLRHIYYGLAAVDLVAVLGGLALSHHLNATLSETVSTNLAWRETHEQISQIRVHASAANAPGTSVFDSKNSALEMDRLSAAVRDFELERQRLGRRLEHQLSGAQHGFASMTIRDIGLAFAALETAAGEVVTLHGDGQIETASRQMAMMQRAYQSVVDRLETLARALRDFEAELNHAKLSAAAHLGWIERMIMALIVLMVISVAFYGRRLEETLRRQSEKLNILNGTLETKIAERTTELQSANAAIVNLNVALTNDIAALELARGELLRSTELLKEQYDRFDAALENMSQGLAWFDGDMTLIICNGRYKDMYHLPDHLAVRGTTFDAIFEHRVAHNLFPKEMTPDAMVHYHDAVFARRSWHKLLSLPDGRHILVNQTPTANGGSLSTHSDVTEHRRLEEQVAFLAAHDALTGLPNRRRLGEEIEKSVAAARRGGSFALLCLDLDHFKRVNDTLGHGVGDKLLCLVAQRLKDNVRATDVVARLGGDEFAVLVNNEAGGRDASQLAARLLEAVSATYEIDGHRVIVGTSIGMARAPQDSLVAAELLRCADVALYVAKSNGRGDYRHDETDMDASVRERRALEVDLRLAIENESFDVHYQPLLEASSLTLLGFEALLRWHHPDRGAVAPLDFIPLAEEIGLMGKIGGIVLKRACREAAGWPEHLRIAVNVSAAQFIDRALELDVMSALAISGLSPSRLELEITESVLLECSEETMAMLQRLRNVGIRLAMDDFGTGYSSFSYLRHLPFTAIKIDRSFIKDVVTEKNTQAIIQAIVKLAQCLGMSTTAEGIETEEQLSCIKSCGCNEVQGYLFSKPIPPSAIASFIRQNGEDIVRRMAAA